MEDVLFLEDKSPADEEPQGSSSHDEEQFLKEILGPDHAKEASEKKTRQEQYSEAKAAPKSTVYMTEGGKEIHVKQNTTGTYRIEFVPGGELPNEMKGSFTREDIAHSAVKSYLANK